MGEHIRMINPSTFGAALAPYSQAAVVGNLVFVAGQVALDEHNDVVGEGDVEKQTTQTIARIRTVLEEAGASLEDIVTATVYLTNMDDFPGFNNAWREQFGDHRPARATVRADLALPGLLVEIQVIAAKAG